MGVVRCDRIEDAEGDRTFDGNLTLSDNYEVEVDSLSDEVSTVLAASGLPQMLSIHPSGVPALCVRHAPSKIPDSLFLWKVRVDYSRRLFGNADLNAGTGTPYDASGATNNPLLRPPRLKFSTVRYQVSMEKDYDGKVIQNSARERYDPPIMVDRAYLALNIQRNLANWIPANMAGFMFSTNIDPWLGFAQDEILLDELEAEPMWENGFFHWQASARFLFNPITVISPGLGTSEGGWFKRVLDAGFMELKADFSQRRIIKDGQFPSRPVLLNGAGNQLTQAEIAAGTVNWRQFRVHLRKSHQALGFL